MSEHEVRPEPRSPEDTPPMGLLPEPRPEPLIVRVQTIEGDDVRTVAQVFVNPPPPPTRDTLVQALQEARRRLETVRAARNQLREQVEHLNSEVERYLRGVRSLSDDKEALLKERNQLREAVAHVRSQLDGSLAATRSLERQKATLVIANERLREELESVLKERNALLEQRSALQRLLDEE